MPAALAKGGAESDAANLLVVHVFVAVKVAFKFRVWGLGFSV